MSNFKCITVTYMQLNTWSCLRETYHADELVSQETLDADEMPMEVRRLMLIPKTIVEEFNDDMYGLNRR